MPQVDFTFSGWVRGANITKATNDKGKSVNVSKMSAKTLAKKLETGKLFISLGDYLYESSKETEIEINDFAASE